MPMSELKGYIRDGLEELGLRDDRVQRLLGAEHEARARVVFHGDLKAPEAADAIKTRHTDRIRIAIDSKTLGAQPGMMQVTRLGSASGEVVSLRGDLSLALDSQSEQDARVEVEEMMRDIRAGLLAHDRIGAGKAIGFGRVLGFEHGDPIFISTCPAQISDAATLESAIPAESNAAPCALFVELEFLDAFCVSDVQPIANHIAAAQVIPGGVLKGAFASTWQADLGRPLGALIVEDSDEVSPELARALEHIVFGHAHPHRVGDTMTPARPWSIGIVGRESSRVVDVSRHASPAAEWLRDGLRFQADWKHSDRKLIDRYLPQVDLKRVQRIRTAIDYGPRRPKEGGLFSQEQIVPRPEDRWSFRIVLPADSSLNQARVRAQLVSRLCSGLCYIGKTKARATCRLLQQPTPVCDALLVPSVPDGNGPWTVMLDTPAILCADEALAPARSTETPNEVAHAPERQPESPLFEAYRSYWHAASGGALRLQRFYARQFLRGGRHLHLVHGVGPSYRPWVMTDAGSVFVLEASAPAFVGSAQGFLLKWSLSGLPLPEIHAGRTAQRHFPYSPENGFGAVRVDPAFSQPDWPPLS